MLTSRPNPVVSPTGIIHVLGYSPAEGERGVPITVRIHCHPDLADAMYVRLVIGHKAVATKVRELPGTPYGRWQLHASAPPVDPDHPKVLIAVQALNQENAIIDSVTFGEFTYWTAADRPALSDNNHLTHLPTPSPTSDHLPPPNMATRRTKLHRRVKSQALMRTKHTPGSSEHPDDIYAQTPILDLVTPLSSICQGWSTQELSAGRRLVRFSKLQDGRRLIVSCESIRQEDYCESDSVISCIYRQETDTCYVTSVDVIYLLERLTNGEFPVEEKNRIRRNLEGLRPTTVSKHKPGFGEFFQHIMEFPDPKPRNIEKDLKVFEWNLLGQALEKILSKYSIYTSPSQDATSESSPAETPSSNSPELLALQLSYPSDEPDRKMYLEGAATASSSSSNFPVFTPNSGYVPPQTQNTAGDGWNTEFKTGNGSADIGLVDHLAIMAYETGAGPQPYVGDPGASFEYNLYDNLNFQSIQDEALAGIPDHYL